MGLIRSIVLAGIFCLLLVCHSAQASTDSTPSIRVVPASSPTSGPQVVLAWNASSGATSYNVYRATTSGGEGSTPFKTGVTSATYTDTGLSNTATYYYEVTAVNSFGESSKSNEAHATTPSAVATFVDSDTSTQGNWKGVYGADGWNVIGDTSSNNPTYPSYATVTPGSHLAGVWSASSLSPAALQSSAAGSANRLGGVWYQTSWSMTVNMTSSHQLALYILDLNNLGFAETISVTDAATGIQLDSRSASSFAGGVYYVWDVSGKVTITFTSTAGHWAVLSGIFFGTGSGSGATAAPAGLTATPGTNQVALSWTASTGAAWYNIYRGTSAGGESATPIASGITKTTYTNTGLADGTKYYFKVVAVNAVGPSFASAEASATPLQATATFVKTDTTTQGSWKGVYGAGGWNVIGDTSTNNPTYPSYASIAPGSHLAGVWISSSTATKCLQVAATNSTNRMAGVWYQTSWSMNVNFTGSHQLALYVLDPNNLGFAQSITIKDAATGAVLSTQSASSFVNGEYYVWTVDGNVTITFASTSTAGHWAVLSGIFFGS